MQRPEKFTVPHRLVKPLRYIAQDPSKVGSVIHILLEGTIVWGNANTASNHYRNLVEVFADGLGMISLSRRGLTVIEQSQADSN